MAKSKKSNYKPLSPVESALNLNTKLPYGLTPRHVFSAMNAFVDFLALVNDQLVSRDLERFEEFLMPANFSSIVGEFMSANMPKFCSGVVKNQYHNGHPDLIPTGVFPNDAVQHDTKGIEVKASRYMKGWQGHNPEDVFLMVFVFSADSPNTIRENQPRIPFHFLEVLGAQLLKSDWQFAGRNGKSRRTITASVKPSGYQKMSQNWIYRLPRD